MDIKDEYVDDDGRLYGIQSIYEQAVSAYSKSQTHEKIHTTGECGAQMREQELYAGEVLETSNQMLGNFRIGGKSSSSSGNMRSTKPMATRVKNCPCILCQSMFRSTRNDGLICEQAVPAYSRSQTHEKIDTTGERGTQMLEHEISEEISETSEQMLGDLRIGGKSSSSGNMRSTKSMGTCVKNCPCILYSSMSRSTGNDSLICEQAVPAYSRSQTHEKIDTTGEHGTQMREQELHAEEISETSEQMLGNFGIGGKSSSSSGNMRSTKPMATRVKNCPCILCQSMFRSTRNDVLICEQAVPADSRSQTHEKIDTTGEHGTHMREQELYAEEISETSEQMLGNFEIGGKSSSSSGNMRSTKSMGTCVKNCPCILYSSMSCSTGNDSLICEQAVPAYSRSQTHEKIDTTGEHGTQMREQELNAGEISETSDQMLGNFMIDGKSSSSAGNTIPTKSMGTRVEHCPCVLCRSMFRSTQNDGLICEQAVPAYSRSQTDEKIHTTAEHGTQMHEQELYAGEISETSEQMLGNFGIGGKSSSSARSMTPTISKGTRVKHCPCVLCRGMSCSTRNSSSGNMKPTKSMGTRIEHCPSVLCHSMFGSTRNSPSSRNMRPTKSMDTRDKHCRCVSCRSMFRSTRNLKFNGLIHTDVKTYKCNLCQKAFFSKGTLKTHHILLHGDAKNHECKVCGKMFPSLFYMKKHSKRHLDGKKYEHGTCKKRIATQQYLTTHIQTYSGVGNYDCEICRKSFTTPVDLTNHLKIDTCGIKYGCEICQNWFATKKELMVHMALHAGSNKCDVCGKSFTSFGFLIRHMKCHSDGKECEICGRLFTSFGLKNHMNMHMGVREYECKVCRKKFAGKKYLNFHMRRQSHNLKALMKTHAGIKGHKCELCQKQLPSKCSLNVHMIVHSGVKNYKCEICGKSFTTLGNLKTHLKAVHCRVKEFNCAKCPKVFSTDAYLKGHYYRMHTKPHNAK